MTAKFPFYDGPCIVSLSPAPDVNTWLVRVDTVEVGLVKPYVNLELAFEGFVFDDNPFPFNELWDAARALVTAQMWRASTRSNPKNPRPFLDVLQDVVKGR
jgi:hypothetical protein